MRARVLLVLAVLVLVAGVAAAWGLGWVEVPGAGEQAAADEGADDDRAVPTTASVERRDLARTEDLEGRLRWAEFAEVDSRLAGTVTALPAVGDVIEFGGQLLRVDDEPVLLLEGEVPAWRPMGSGVEGVDVEQLQRNLNDLGYGDLSEDGVFGAATRRAVRDWQDDLGLERSGNVPLGRVRFASAPLVVRELAVVIGDVVGEGVPVLGTSSTAQVVRTALGARDRDWLAEGDAVTVELPDGEEAAGTVSEVGPLAESADDRAHEVVITLDDAEPVDAHDGTPVDVRVVRESVEGALTVPVHALVALAEGGYAVEVVSGDGRVDLVGVETGMHQDGVVAIEGPVSVGDEVVIP